MQGLSHLINDAVVTMVRPDGYTYLCLEKANDVKRYFSALVIYWTE